MPKLYVVGGRKKGKKVSSTVFGRKSWSLKPLEKDELQHALQALNNPMVYELVARPKLLK